MKVQFSMVKGCGIKLARLRCKAGSGRNDVTRVQITGSIQTSANRAHCQHIHAALPPLNQSGVCASGLRQQPSSLAPDALIAKQRQLKE